MELAEHRSVPLCSSEECVCCRMLRYCADAYLASCVSEHPPTIDASWGELSTLKLRRIVSYFHHLGIGVFEAKYLG